MSEQDGIHIGQVIASQFNILKKLGAGGMGSVFLAEQLGMDRRVVVKVMHPELTAGSPQAVERFKREAKAVAQLNHPNIVQVYVFGQTSSGQMYIAMEYIEGRDLTSELVDGPLDQIRALKILDQVLSALVEAHAAGIVHRDLKPDNIMLTDRHGNPDYVKVLDFGIAKMADPAQATITQAGAVFGTPRYMAPEQAKGVKIDARADLYALGVILYELLTGVHPFREATTALEYIVKHATEDIHAPSVDFDGLDIAPRIESLLTRCVAKDPEQRFQSAREMQRELRLALRDFPEAARGFPTDGANPPMPSRLSERPAGAPKPAAVAKSKPPTATPAAASAAAKAPAAPRHGTPAWVWALVAVLVAGGIATGVVLGTQGQPGPTDPPVAATAPTADPHAGDPTAPPDPTRAADPGAALTAAPPEDPTTAPADPTPARKTDVAEGMPIDGFPVPARARVTTSTPQADILETDLTGREIIDFYMAKLAGRYGAVQEVPNGVMIAGEDTPFSTVSIMSMGEGLNIVLARNSMAKNAGKAVSVAGQDFFGVTAVEESSIMIKTPDVATLRTRRPMAEVCAFYTERFGNLKGVTVLQDVEAASPYCNFAAGPEAETLWGGIAILPDPSSTNRGSLMISIQARK